MKKSLYSEESARLIKWLKKKRIEAGYSQRDIARLTNLDYSILAKIETGERRIDIVEFVTYCKVLGADPKEGISVVDADPRKIDSRFGFKKQ